MNNSFKHLELNPLLLANLDELKFESMTPIQAQSLPLILKKQDVIAQAKTGSGKTAAFGLGILQALDSKTVRTQAFILCPTRELAEQVASEIRMLARKLSNIRVLTLCGGAPEFKQEKSLQHGAHIIVATPGRILRLLKRGLVDLQSIDTFVLDEADRMLDMGFIDDIKAIISYLPERKQTLLFSATFPSEIQELSKNIQHEASFVKVDTTHAVDTIDEFFFEVVGHQDKSDALLALLGHYQPSRLIVFCRTRQITDSVARFLLSHDIAAAAIHGDLTQEERTTTLTKLTHHSLSILVATDVAARGLDISDLEAIVNFDLPSDPEVYIHRIGRTGRAGKKGLALNLFLQAEAERLQAIEEFTKKPCTVIDGNDLNIDRPYLLKPPMRTLIIYGGKKDKLRPGDILGALIGEAELNALDVGEISIFPTVSFVSVKRELANEAIKDLNAGKIKNRRFRVGSV